MIIVKAGGKTYLRFKKSEIPSMPKSARTFLGKQTEDALEELRNSINGFTQILRFARNPEQYGKQFAMSLDDGTPMALRFLKAVMDATNRLSALTDDQASLETLQDIFSLSDDINDLLSRAGATMASPSFRMEFLRVAPPQWKLVVMNMFPKLRQTLKSTAYDDTPASQQPGPNKAMIPPPRRVY